MGRLSVRIKPSSWPVYAVFGAFLLFVAWNGVPRQIIAWDVLGYYLILPLTFIYHDPGLANADAFTALINDYQATDAFYQMIQTAESRWVMKYPLGMAVFYLPFFVLGHLTALLLGAPTDGLSAPYNAWMALGSVSYSFIGIYFTFRVLQRHFTVKSAAIALIVVLLGTNWLITHGISMMMPHIPLFATTAFVLWLTPLWLAAPTFQRSAALGAVLGLAALARPTEAWLAVVPLFWGMDGWTALKNRLHALFQHKLKYTLLTAAVGMAIVAPQFLYWKWATGSFLYTEYGNAGEGLDLNRPHLTEFLFSFRKGWLVYTPLMALALVGLIALWRRHRALFWPVALFIFGAIYLAASWSTWWYAASFSQRAMVQVLPVLALPLAALLEWTSSQKAAVRAAVFLPLAVGFALNTFQTWQFTQGILPPDRITKAYYKAVFLATEKPAGADALLLIDRSRAYPPSYAPAENGYRALPALSVLHPLPFEVDSAGQFAAAELPKSEGNYHQVFAHYDRITHADHAFLVLDGWIKVADTAALANNYVVGSAHYRKAPYAYHARPLNEVLLSAPDTGVWMPFRFTYLTPEFRRRDDVVTLYFWRRDTAHVILANVSVTPYIRTNAFTTLSP